MYSEFHKARIHESHLLTEYVFALERVPKPVTLYF